MLALRRAAGSLRLVCLCCSRKGGGLLDSQELILIVSFIVLL